MFAVCVFTLASSDYVLDCGRNLGSNQGIYIAWTHGRAMRLSVAMVYALDAISHSSTRNATLMWAGCECVCVFALLRGLSERDNIYSNQNVFKH